MTDIAQTAGFISLTLAFVPLSYYLSTPLGVLEHQCLTTMLWITSFSASYCFLAGEITRNVSQVDKLWTLLPVIYNLVMASYGGFTLRLTIMTVLTTLWSCHLTSLFAKKGGYSLKFWSGEEDYRWGYIRKRPEFQGRLVWTLFNLFFISIYQNLLILLFNLPMLVALQFNTTSLNWLDCLATVLVLVFILLEVISDYQQMDFQTKKRAMLKSSEPLTGRYKNGFLDDGLFAICRHPNYLGEIGIWTSFYIFSVASSGQILNWSLIGSLLLIILFTQSSKLSEEICVSKYPEYKSYQLRVPKFIPFI